MSLLKGDAFELLFFLLIDLDPFVDFGGVGWKEVTWPDTAALLVSFGLTWRNCRSTSNSDKLKESAKSFVTLF